MNPPRTSTAWPSLAADTRAAYAPAPGPTPPHPDGDAPLTPSAGRHERLRAAVHDVTRVAVSALAGDEVRDELEHVEAARRALSARSCRLTSALAARAAAAARAQAGDDPRAGERAARQVRSELAEGLRLSPSQVLAAQRIGDRADASPTVASAMDDGTISPAHVRAIDRTLQHLAGDERLRAERVLVEVAGRGSVRDVHDAGVRLLCEFDHDAAVDAQRRRQARRECSVTRTRDGMVRISGQVTGLQGELVLTAFHAFRRPDRSDEQRTPGQRGADALADLCRAAVGDPPASGRDGPRPESGPSAVVATSGTSRARAPARQHGIAPHVSITIDLDTLLTGTGVAEADWSGPVPWGAVRDVLDHADLTFIALREQVPVAVTQQTRYVPTGLWKALRLRDRGCIRTHCDAPAAWCQVAHLDRWFADGGKLALDTAGLLCTTHHRQFDAGRLRVTWVDRRPMVHPPAEPPAEPSIGRPAEPPDEPPPD